MTTLSTLTLRTLGTDRAVVTPDGPKIIYAPRSGYAAVIQYRPRGERHTLRVTLPWCATREGARYTAEVATHYLTRPALAPVAQEMGAALQRPAQRPATPPAQRPAPGSPPARRPAQR